MNTEREEILENLRNVKQTATHDLAKTDENKSEVVQNVNYLGTIELQRRDGEEADSFELYTVEVYDYDSDKIETKIYLDGQEVDMGELMRTYENIEPIKDVVGKAKENQEKDSDKENQYNLNEMEEEKVREYAGVVGKDKEDIEEIDELELDQELKEKENENEEEKITKNAANSLTKREETSLEQKIKGTTLRNVLGLSGEYEKIAIVSSSQVNKYTNPEKRHNNIDSFVAIKANGEAIVLGEDIIKQDRQEGINSTSVDLTANVNGEVDYEQNRSSYEIVKSPGLYIKVGYDENHGREIKIEDRAKGYGDRGIAYELETSNTWRADDDVRRMQRDKEGIYAADKAIESQKEHEEVGCENDRVKNIDEYDDNNTHEHIEIEEDEMIPNTNTTWREFANMCGYRGENAIEKAQEELEKYKEDYPDVSNEEAIEEIKEEIENEMPGPNRNIR